MKKHTKPKKYPRQRQRKPDMVGQIEEVFRLLTAMEAKIDTLINKFSSEPISQARPVAPLQARTFDRPRQQNENRQESRYIERVLHKAVCADCHTECEVPFKPSQDRPVYCKKCFAIRKNGPSTNVRQDIRPAPAAPVQARHGNSERFGSADSGKRIQKRPKHKRS